MVAAAARRVVVAAATWAEVEPKAAWALAKESTCEGGEVQEGQVEKREVEEGEGRSVEERGATSHVEPMVSRAIASPAHRK